MLGKFRPFFIRKSFRQIRIIIDEYYNKKKTPIKPPIKKIDLRRPRSEGKN